MSKIVLENFILNNWIETYERFIRFLIYKSSLVFEQHPYFGKIHAYLALISRATLHASRTHKQKHIILSA